VTKSLPALPAGWYRDDQGVVRYRDTDKPVICQLVVGRSLNRAIRCGLPYGHDGPHRGGLWL
jgi:hypothetical protein